MDEDLDNDEDLMAEISLELSRIDLNSHIEENPESPAEAQHNEVVLPDLDTNSFEDYHKRLTSQRQAFDKQLEECTELLQITEEKLSSSANVNLSELFKEYGQDGEDEEGFRARMYAEIEADDDSDDVITDNSTDMEMADVNSLEVVAVPSTDEDGNTTNRPESAAEPTQPLAIEDRPKSSTRDDQYGTLVEYEQNNIRMLQSNAKVKMSELKRRQQATSEKASEDREHFLQSIEAQERLAESERQHRQAKFEQEAQEVNKLKAQKEFDLEQELKLSEKRLRSISKEFEAQIYKLEKQTEAEKCRLKTEIDSIAERREHREMNAATQIQSVYRGYRIRQKHGAQLKMLVEEKLAEIETRRIESANQRIEGIKAQQRMEEEKRLAAEAEKAQLEEEAKQKEIQMKQAREEALRLKLEQEAEEKRILEEKKRREKEIKEEEKRRKKEEKERLRKEKEEKKRLQREQEELERQKKEQEKKERLAREQEQGRLARDQEQERLAREQEKEKRERLKHEKEKEQLVQKQKTEKAEKEKLRPAKELEIKPETESNAKATDLSVPEIPKTDQKDPSGSIKKNRGEDNQSILNNDELPYTHDIGSDKVVHKEENSISNLQSKRVQKLDTHHRVTTLDAGSKSNENAADNESAHLKNTVSQEMLLAKEKAEKEQKVKEYKTWMEERKAKLATAALSQQSASAPSLQQQTLDVNLIEAKIEERRLRWMQECTPWSQVSSKGMTNTHKVRKSYKRPSSAAKKLDPIEETVLLSQSGQQSMTHVEAVQLTDLPGCRLSTLSRCKKLKALSITRSGVCAIDSLNNATSLLYAHLKGNAIDHVELSVSSLVHLNLSSNQLTSMRGFESCTNIRYLNLSNNKISKIATLGVYQSLHTLDLSYNELISTRGIGDCVTVQVLDLSNNHLTSIDEVGKLCLLRNLTASSNNIMEIPRLTNCVLLESLRLDDNSISSLDGLAYFWLPSLKLVNLKQNCISTIQPPHGCFNMRTLDLSHNQVIDCKNALDGLKHCISMEELLLNGNPVGNSDMNRRALCNALPQLKKVDDLESTCFKPVELQSDILNMSLNSWTEFSNLDQRYQSVISDNLAQHAISNTELLEGVQQLTSYYDISHSLAENVRYSHEFGSMSFEVPQQQAAAVSSKELFEAKLAAAEIQQEQSAQPDTSSAKDLFEQKLKATLESTPLRVSTENIKILRDCASPRPNSRHGRTHANKSRTPRSARCPASHTVSMSNGVSGHSKTSLEDKLERERNAAAVKIQALWRGHSFRRRLLLALEQAKGYAEEDSDEEIAEVDLSSFDMNLDDDWLPPDIPQLPQKHAILPPRSSALRLGSGDGNFSNEHLAAWVPSAEHSIDSALYLDPPLSSMSGDLSHRSKREEMIAQDWGFKDSHTAELMMKRAKKLKYNSERKKKMDKLGPMGRYELQRKILQNIEPPKVVAPMRKVAPKKEYFKALEEDAQKRNWAKAEETDAAIERTYEWIHTQVSRRQPGQDEKVEREERVSSGESQLPYMDKRLLEGGRPQLVNSPLEIMSVSSYYGPSSADSRGRGQNSSLVSNKADIKSQQNKQQTSKPKHKELDGFNAWGAGKKRTTR